MENKKVYKKKFVRLVPQNQPKRPHWKNYLGTAGVGRACKEVQTEKDEWLKYIYNNMTRKGNFKISFD